MTPPPRNSPRKRPAVKAWGLVDYKGRIQPVAMENKETATMSAIVNSDRLKLGFSVVRVLIREVGRRRKRG